MTTNLHAHVDTFARDCDGGHGDDYIMALSADEVAHSVKANGINDFHEIIFRDRVVASVVNSYSIEEGFTGTLQVTAHGLDWSEPTDEGYRRTEVRWCEDEECDPNARAVFDEYAEAMGY